MQVTETYQSSSVEPVVSARGRWLGDTLSSSAGELLDISEEAGAGSRDWSATALQDPGRRVHVAFVEVATNATSLLFASTYPSAGSRDVSLIAFPAEMPKFTWNSAWAKVIKEGRWQRDEDGRPQITIRIDGALPAAPLVGSVSVPIRAVWPKTGKYSRRPTKGFNAAYRKEIEAAGQIWSTYLGGKIIERCLRETGSISFEVVRGGWATEEALASLASTRLLGEVGNRVSQDLWAMPADIVEFDPLEEEVDDVADYLRMRSICLVRKQ